MSIEKIEEFAESGEKHLNNLDVKQGFQQAEKPERQWFNYLLNDFSKKINQVIDGLSDIDFEFDGFAPKISELESNYTEISSELTRVSDDFKSADAVLQGQIDGIGGGKFAYTTYAKMEAAAALPDEDPLKLPANSSIDVTNDTDPLKNGTYSYDGAVFAKSIYDVETIVRTKVLNTFKTKALMDASVLPDGADAQVTNDTANNGLYVKTAGAWVRSGYDPVSLANTHANNYTDNALDPVSIERNNIGDDTIIAFTDNDYNILAKIDGELTAHFKAISCESISTAGIDIYEDDSTSNQLTVTDGSGLIIELYDSNGNYKSVNSSSTALKDDEPQPRMITDIFHIASAGQSLSLGIGSEKRITRSSDAPNALIPSRGMLDGQLENEGVSGLPLLSDSLIAFNPSIGNYSTIEAPILATTAYLQQTFDNKGIASHVLPSNHGHGAWEIAQLEKGTPSFTVGIEQSKKYKEYASNMGKSLLTQFILWFQGETDITRGYSQQYYLDKLRQLAKDYRQDMAQGVDPMLLTYQTGSHTKRGVNSSPKVPYAQLQAANIDPYIKMVCPTYMMTYSDGVHMKADSYRWMGCYFGKVINWMLENNRTDWKPVQPERIIRTGKVVTIEFHVPVKPLLLDTDLVSDPNNYGFTVKDSAGIELTIVSVSVVGDDKVNIVLNSTPTSPVTVSYGLGVIGSNAGATTGARGNLRDSDDTDSLLLDESGSKYTLYNWCVLFTQKEGFTWEL